ncbi:hypothetical protein SD71_06165 [Cohnella kolymensis]|uniref:DUF4179 domain-containing protein n=1 Tax=Cohnella kolymensis TaxID=1590652 RepID=A0ABR5A6K0_9BACL|nr:DUF4179 domain-containing protein [Cohnella kolymensis]KIL36605.1 hypothetical protein SD71_06165 [Cohnella kolymensis]
MDFLENELSKAGNRGAHSPIPDSVDFHILQGIEKGRAERDVRRRSFRRKIGSSAAVCLLLICCVFSIRISPVFASMVRDIPGMEAFVDLIRNQDRGLQLAVDNDFIQPVGVSDEHDGVRFTVEGILADETRLVIFYAIEAANWEADARIDNPAVKDIHGKSLPASYSYGDPSDSEQDGRANVYRGTIDMQMVGQAIPKELVLSTKIKLYDNSLAPVDARISDIPQPRVAEVPDDRPVYQVTIPVDHAKFAGMKEEYPLNKTIEVEGQRIHILKATVHPLRIAVELAYDEKNLKHIFGPGDIHLTDDKGTVWNSYLATGNTIYFESNFFDKPKELYVEGKWFRAVEKDKMEVVIDTDAKKMIKAPDDKLRLKEVAEVNGFLKMTLAYVVDNEEDNMGYSFLEQAFKDGEGNTYKMADVANVVSSTRSFRGEGTATSESYHYLNIKDYNQPLTFKVWNYPNYISQPYKVRIK